MLPYLCPSNHPILATPLCETKEKQPVLQVDDNFIHLKVQTCSVLSKLSKKTNNNASFNELQFMISLSMSLSLGCTLTFTSVEREWAMHFNAIMVSRKRPFSNILLLCVKQLAKVCGSLLRFTVSSCRQKSRVSEDLGKTVSCGNLET